jgi:hypothetical protein
MTLKVWTAAEIRSIARQTVDGRERTLAARGAYFRALVETAQAELGRKAGRDGQIAAVRAVHKRFYPVVLESVVTEDIAKADKLSKQERRRRSLERNRRSNFARSAYGTIRRWLRADGHDLMKLDSQKVTKSQLLEQAPPARKHPMTPNKVKARAERLIGGLVGFTKAIAREDQDQAASVANEAIEALIQLIARMGTERKTTTDAKVAVREMRPLKVGNASFWPMDLPIAK